MSSPALFTSISCSPCHCVKNSVTPYLSTPGTNTVRLCLTLCCLAPSANPHLLRSARLWNQLGGRRSDVIVSNDEKNISKQLKKKWLEGNNNTISTYVLFCPFAVGERSQVSEVILKPQPQFILNTKPLLSFKNRNIDCPLIQLLFKQYCGVTMWL